MNNKEKQIEEMAKVLEQADKEAIIHCAKTKSCNECKYNKGNSPCPQNYRAEALYNAGYRKVDEIEKMKFYKEAYEQGKFDANAEIAIGEKVIVERPAMCDLLNEEMQSLMCDGKVCFTADEMVEQANDLIKLAEENEALKKQKANNLVVEIVMSGEELEKIKNECLERVEYNIQEIRKETAREILHEVKQRICDREIEAERILRCIKFDELEEKFGVEVE